MRQNYNLSLDNLRSAEGLIIPALSGEISGVAADADLYSLVSWAARPLIISAIRTRWVSKTSFATPQALAFRVSKAYEVIASHDAGGKSVQAHHKAQAGIVGSTTGERVPLSEIEAYISIGEAITGGDYTPVDVDEPEVFAVGAGASLPGVYDDWVPVDGLPLVLTSGTGFLLNNVIAMGVGGAGHLYVGVDAYRLAP